MRVTYHAVQRFLERVVKKLNFSKYEVHRTVEYLENLLKDIVVTSYAKPFALPGYQKLFYVVHQENCAITIVPKNKKEFKSRHNMTREKNMINKIKRGALYV